MVGDITGRSWNSVAPPTSSSIGIVNKNPNLFSDLVGPALGQNKGNSNVPLKNATPTLNKSAYSMGGMADSLQKTTSSVSSGGNWGSSVNASGFKSSGNVNLGSNKSPNLGGPSMKSATGSGFGGGMSSDPFGSLVDFSSKPAASMNTASKGTNKANLVDDAFGDFQNAPKSTTSSYSSNAFGDFQNASKSSTSSFTSNAFPNNNNNNKGSSTASYSNMDDFGFSSTQNQPPVQSSGFDSFDGLFSSSSASVSATKGTDGFGSEQFSGADDWDTEFGGGNETGGTTELDGLPPPPAGVSVLTAKTKGMDNYKQGQYPDAIKWLSWAIILLEKVGDNAGTMEVLSSRASCYKEVGEYKKAVADCTKV